MHYFRPDERALCGLSSDSEKNKINANKIVFESMGAIIEAFSAISTKTNTDAAATTIL